MASPVLFSCGGDNGFGVATNVWSTTTNDGAVYPTSNSYVVIIGASATTTNEKLEIHGIASGDYLSATSPTATSTLRRLSLTTLLLNGDYITDLVGSGLVLSSGTLSATTTGNWAGTL